MTTDLTQDVTTDLTPVPVNPAELAAPSASI